MQNNAPAVAGPKPASIPSRVHPVFDPILKVICGEHLAFAGRKKEVA